MVMMMSMMMSIMMIMMTSMMMMMMIRMMMMMIMMMSMIMIMTMMFMMSMIMIMMVQPGSEGSGRTQGETAGGASDFSARGKYDQVYMVERSLRQKGS